MPLPIVYEGASCGNASTLAVLADGVVIWRSIPRTVTNLPWLIVVVVDGVKIVGVVDGVKKRIC